MTRKQLLQQCEQLTYRERMKLMVEMGRQAITDENVRETIAKLAQGDVYQRCLATQSCYGSRDAKQALKSFFDPAHDVRSIALKLVVMLCSDEDIIQILDRVSFDLKRTLLSVLIKKHRQAPIDGYIEVLVTRQDSMLIDILPYGSLKIVQHYIDRVVGQFKVKHWKQLARIHTTLAVELLQKRVSHSDLFEWSVLSHINGILPVVIDRNPDLTVAFIRSIVHIFPLHRLSIDKLMQQRPNEMAALMLETDVQDFANFFRNTSYRKISSDNLIKMFSRIKDFNPHYFYNFKKLTLSQRLALYHTYRLGWRDKDGILLDPIIQYLPTTERIQEARRHCQLPALVTNVARRINYLTFLPWDEAWTLAQDTLHLPDPMLRGASLAALIRCTRYQPEKLDDVLDLVLQRGKEQDPVRSSMIEALSDLPFGRWSTAHLDKIQQIIQDTLDAKSLLNMAYNLEKLILKLLRFHPEWAAQQLVLLYRKSGSTALGSLEDYLTEAETRFLAPYLVPVLTSWRKKESEELVDFAESLGKRLRVFHELVDLLESFIDDLVEPDQVSTMIEVFAENYPERLQTIIPRLLKKDKSSGFLELVYTYLHRHRQDLITPYLGQKMYKGKFSSGKICPVLELNQGFFRWTPTQQEIYARTLVKFVRDDENTTYEIIEALQRLAELSYLDPSPLLQFASDTRVPVQEETIKLLAHLDTNQGMPVLLEALNDQRARIAIYALRKVLFATPKDEALQLLLKVSSKQVTVAKEVVRLIGELGTDEAYQELLALYRQKLHRDVRVALLHAFWSYTERAETWDILMEAAQSSDLALARSLVRIPTDGMSVQSQQRLVQILAVLIKHPEALVRMDVLERCYQYPVNDVERVLYPILLQALNTPLFEQCQKASQAVFALYKENDTDLISEVFQHLLHNRQALKIAVETFQKILYRERLRLLPTTRVILSVLAQDRLTLSLRIGLIVAGLPWEEVGSELVQLVDNLHSDALSKAQHALLEVSSRADFDLEKLEQMFVNSEDERLRRLAFTLLTVQAQRTAKGWSDELISRLELYRQDPSPLVAEAAQFTFIH